MNTLIQKNVVIFIGKILLALTFFYPFLAYAQLEGFFKALKGLNQETGGAVAKSGRDGSPSETGGGGGNVLGNIFKSMAVNTASSELRPSDQWCESQVGSLKNIDIDTSVIESEFKIKNPEQVQGLFVIALKKNNISKAFPNAKFYQSSFETKQVRSIYDSFLSYPEAETLAALIQISRQKNLQEAQDALMALTFLHLQASHLSITKDRWRELHNLALEVENFPALVFKARMATYGDYAKKNIPVALGDLQTAGSLRDKYRNSDGFKKEFDTQNYQIAYNKTVNDIMRYETNMPYRAQWTSVGVIASDIEKAQADFEKELPNTRIGKMYSIAAKLNLESMEIGNKIIGNTKGGNKLTAQIANLKSIQNKSEKNKKIITDISPDIHVAQMNMINNMNKLNDSQKEMLLLAQEKRYMAQGIISKTYGEIIDLMQTSFGGGIVAMAAPLPVLKLSNNTLIQSCAISLKWEQAMRAKEVVLTDTNRIKKMNEDINTLYKD